MRANSKLFANCASEINMVAPRLEKNLRGGSYKGLGTGEECNF